MNKEQYYLILEVIPNASKEDKQEVVDNALKLDLGLELFEGYRKHLTYNQCQQAYKNALECFHYKKPLKDNSWALN